MVQRVRLPRASSLFGAVVVLVGCGSPEFETVHTLSPPTWFEDGWSYYDVSPDESKAVFGARFGYQVVDLLAHREESARYEALEQAREAAGPGWAVPVSVLPEEALPAGALVERSPDGERAAFFVPGSPVLAVAGGGRVVEYEMGGVVTGVGWVPAGDVLYALVLLPDGTSSLVRVSLETRSIQALRENLDAPHRFNSVGVSPDARRLYLALAGEGAPDPEARHRPDADRDTDIYAYDLKDGELELVAAAPGDDFHPEVRGEFLYWTHNEFEDEIVVVPTGGGQARVVVRGAQLPSFSPDGGQLAFTYGGWRIADWGLNLDAAVVTVDDSVKSTSAPQPLVAGYHEDFTPAWSPDGRWIAYHSHRAARAVPSYSSTGSSDDLYLRRPGDPTSAEIRLTDFGWEVGTADWSPDGRQLVFDSWARGGQPGVAHPWILTIDPGTGRRVGARRLPLPRSVRGSLFTAWSPGGGEIALIAKGEGRRQELWVLSPDGRRAERLAEFEATTYGGVDWAPDGSQLIYSALAGGKMQLFSLPRAGGVPRQLTRDEASLIHPQVSPDGRWIAATRVIRHKELRRKRI